MTFKGMDRRGMLLAGVAGFTLLSGAALAQETEEPPAGDPAGESPAAETVQEAAEETENQQAAPEATPEDEIVVTGSRLRRSEFTSSAPISVINAEEATLEGLVDTADIVQGSSLAKGSVQLNNQFGGFVVEGGTGINSISLRGLGAQRSLVLLNGKRPGPAGVRGQVAAFDLNVIPDSVVQRVEILKDGASSIYGSDAVAGVVNVITLTSVDRPSLTIQTNQPFEGHGEFYSVDGAYGFNFDRGSIALAGSYDLQQDLSIGDRDFLACPDDIFFDAQTGERIDREDRSILAGTNLGGCSSGNLYFNTAIELFSGLRYIPSPDGVTIGPIPGYRPRANGRYDDGDGEPAFYEDVLNDARVLGDDAINQNERFSLYGVSDFELMEGIDWKSELLFTRRQTRAEGSRQFFPLIADSATLGPAGFPQYVYANDPDYSSPLLLTQPVLYYPSNTEVTVDYFYGSTELTGGFGDFGGEFLSDWVWTAFGNYSRSEGTYINENQIFQDLSGDVQYDDDAPMFDYLSPAFLRGDYPDGFYDAIGGDIEGETIYDQWTVSAYASGDLFELPAGEVLLAGGFEYRDFSIEDTPDEQARPVDGNGDGDLEDPEDDPDGNLWGFTSAGITAGSDNVLEGFAEIEVPIVSGKPFMESLTFNASGRVFDYESTGSDAVYKVGVNWQVVPAIRLRGTYGTSYRSPALFELFLANQTAFASQRSIDPCIDYQNSTDEDIRRNCAAIGIPADYQGGGSSATIISGGNPAALVPETSDASTVGVIFTPDQIPLSVAVDYFEIEVQDQITQLGATSIVNGCYNSENFPNAFCDLFTRGTANSEFAIVSVFDQFQNINSQETRGIDLTTRYEQEFEFGTVLVDLRGTWTLEDTFQLFAPDQVSGFDTNDFNRTIGDPDVVLDGRIQLERGDWTYSWFSNFVGHTSNETLADDETTYFGRPATRYVETEAVWYHDASVRWEGDLLSITGGITNIFDEDPPIVSSGCCTRRGNVPLVGTQYDLLGRTAFFRVTKEF